MGQTLKMLMCSVRERIIQVFSCYKLNFYSFAKKGGESRRGEGVSGASRI